MKCLVRCVIAMINETLLKTLIVIISLLAIGAISNRAVLAILLDWTTWWVFVYNACSTSGYDERYGSDRTDIEKIKCSYRNDNFECTFKCLQDNMQPNAVIRCRENRWYETFIKDTKNICSPINNIKIRKLSKSSSPQLKSSSSGLSRRHQNRHHQQYQPQVDTRVLSTCFTGTVNEGREQFNQFYVGQVDSVYK